jgi:hypothetical protein
LAGLRVVLVSATLQGVPIDVLAELELKEAA